MRLKAHSLIILCILLTLLTVTIGTADSAKFKEPQNNKNVPPYAVWDSELGLYISIDVYKDPQTGTLYDKKVLPQKQTGTSELLDPETLWIQKHQHTSDRIDAILLDYIEKQQKNTVVNFSSHYDPTQDPYLKAVLDSFGYEDIQTMLNKILDDDYAPVAGIMMTAINIKTKTNNGNIAYDMSSKKSWTDQINDKRKKAKDAPSLSDDELNSIGMLAIPYLASEADFNNAAAIHKILTLTGNEKFIEKENWETWKTENVELIHNINEFINN